MTFAEPIPAVFSPPEIVFRLPKSTEECVGEGRSDVALVGATEGGGEEELVTSMSSPYVELLTGDPGGFVTLRAFDCDWPCAGINQSSSPGTERGGR